LLLDWSNVLKGHGLLVRVRHGDQTERSFAYRCHDFGFVVGIDGRRWKDNGHFTLLESKTPRAPMSWKVNELVVA
jgi:hypothetical protein